MRTTIRAFLAFVTMSLVLVNTGFADSDKYSKSHALKKYLDKNITYPYQTLENTKKAFVLVDFTLSDTGDLEVNGINYSDESLKKYVIEELNKLKRKKNQEMFGKTYIYKFVFCCEGKSNESLLP